MERKYLLCALTSKYVALGVHDAKLLKEKLDMELLEAKQKPLGQELGDIEFLDEYFAEIQIFVMGKGINRKQRRR